ncbi:ribonuclease P protein subunit p20 isoform X1 [Aethina tumida]|uniref:ribonuclease P protein subunit p20 isoform X1 n=1 Tax=Aethina tumida TaxID=116153 RepID=UPI00096B578F|nr:ribonuclease P protein subunit p20 isoform X1 [Aethina tumida]
MSDNSKNSEVKKQNRNPSKDHTFRKRNPPKPERDESVIYVSTKTHFKAIEEKCVKLINKDTPEIIIYCLGAAIQRSIILALRLCDSYTNYNIHTNTLTTELIDDLEPAADDADYEIQRRNNSALRIRLYRKDLLETERE